MMDIWALTLQEASEALASQPSLGPSGRGRTVRWQRPATSSFLSLGVAGPPEDQIDVEIKVLHSMGVRAHCLSGRTM